MVLRVAVLLVLLTTSVCAETVAVEVRIRNEKGEEKFIMHANLLSIKEFILKNGKTETFSSAYNNNPVHETKSFHFYLIPDVGGPDRAKTDFNSIMIRSKENEYYLVDFRRESMVSVTVTQQPAENLTVKGIRSPIEKALQEILADIDAKPPASAPAPR